MKTSKMILSVTLCALTIFQTPFAQADKQDIGAILGVLLGGAVANRASNGDVGATIAGAVVVGIIGGAIGRELDQNDRREMLRARGDCLERNEQAEWRGNGGYGSVVILQEGYHSQRSEVVCRSYENTIYHHGRREITRGYACRGTNGSWNEVRETEIAFGRPDFNEHQPQPDYNRPGYPPVSHGASLMCVSGHYGAGLLVNRRTNAQIAMYFDIQGCNFALQNQRGALICIEGQNRRDAFAIDVRTLQSVGYLYRNLQDCVRNLR